MFCVLYRFRVRAGQTAAFLDAWALVTEAFMQHCGGLGSRLHRADDGFVAYAQWATRAAWESAELPADVRAGAWTRMRACCELVEQIETMTVERDLLQAPPAS